ncbi:MAG: mechanosensitive ion channel protein MscS [Mucilaginibacter sp.]|nr:mechanosensitive ion channel protein MscS [Mucilaginibacter sp.]
MHDTIKSIFESWTGQIQSWAWNLIIVFLAVVIGLAIRLIVGLLLNFYKKQADYSLFRSIIAHIGPPLNHFIPLLLINMMFPLMELGSRYYELFSRAAEIALMISFSILLMDSIKIFEDYVYHTYDLNKTDNLKSGRYGPN